MKWFNTIHFYICLSYYFNIQCIHSLNAWNNTTQYNTSLFREGYYPKLNMRYILDSRNTLHYSDLQYIPRNMHAVFALLCFVVVIHWLIFPYPSGLLHWHCGNLTIATMPAKQPWWIWINTSYEFIMNDCITTTKQSTTKPCAYFLGYTVTRIQIRACINNPIQVKQRDWITHTCPGFNGGLIIPSIK